MQRMFILFVVIVLAPSFLYAQNEGGDSAQPSKIPVLIVPGILGTKIFKDYGDNAELWPRIAALVTSPEDSFMEDLGLAPDGTEIIERPMRIGDIIRSISFGIDVHPYLMAQIAVTASHVFDRFIDEMEQQGYVEGVDLFVFPYDWRLDNATNIDQLKTTIEKIQQITGKSQVSIVAHSMGGLLVKDYIFKYGVSLIQSIFFIGTPHLGAPKAFKALMFGDDMGIRIPIKGILSSLLNPKTVKSISKNMASVYELLPSKKYVEDNAYVKKDGTALSFEDTVAMLAGSGRNKSLIDIAQDFHQDIDTLDLGTKVVNFIGCDDKPNTVGSIDIRKKKPWLPFLKESEEIVLGFVKGDETVPMQSALMNDAENLFIKGVSHGELPSTEGVGTYVANFLNDIHQDLPASVSGDDSVCKGAAGIIVSKHSPVEMHIYDNDGNHTGPIETGDIEYGIRGVTYEQIEETSYAYLPLDREYKIVNTPTETGSFDFYAEYVDGDGKISKKQIWNEVAIDSIDMNFELSVSENGIDSMTMIGDAIESKDIKPELLAGESLSDTNPPVTSASVANGMLLLQSSDDASGVEKTEYSFDQNTWSEYDGGIPVSEGQKVYYLSIDKAGNLEDLKIFTIPEKKPEKKEVAISKKTTSGSIPKIDTSIPIDLKADIKTEQNPSTPIASVQIQKKSLENKPSQSKVRVKRRKAVVNAKPKEKTIEQSISNIETKKVSKFVLILSKIKSIVYYLIWHMKAIIS